METQTFIRLWGCKQLREYVRDQARRHFHNTDDQADAVQEAWYEIGVCTEDVDEGYCQTLVDKAIRRTYRVHRQEIRRAVVRYHDALQGHQPECPPPKEEWMGLLTIREASNLTRLAVKTLYNLASLRRIPYVKLGGRIFFDEDRLDVWIRDHVVDTPQAR